MCALLYITLFSTSWLWSVSICSFLTLVPYSTLPYSLLLFILVILFITNIVAVALSSVDLYFIYISVTSVDLNLCDNPTSHLHATTQTATRATNQLLSDDHVHGLNQHGWQFNYSINDTQKVQCLRSIYRMYIVGQSPGPNVPHSANICES